MHEEKIKHLEFIQVIIARMNTNSFQIKELTIAFITVLLALCAFNDKPANWIFITIVPVFLFCLLDTYYLQQERKFRGLYNDVVESIQDESAKNILLFSMPINNYTGREYDYRSTLKSPAIWPFYVCIILVVLVGWLLK